MENHLLAVMTAHSCTMPQSICRISDEQVKPILAKSNNSLSVNESAVYRWQTAWLREAVDA